MRSDRGIPGEMGPSHGPNPSSNPKMRPPNAWRLRLQSTQVQGLRWRERRAGRPGAGVGEQEPSGPAGTPGRDPRCPRALSPKPPTPQKGRPLSQGASKKVAPSALYHCRNHSDCIMAQRLLHMPIIKMASSCHTMPALPHGRKRNQIASWPEGFFTCQAMRQRMPQDLMNRVQSVIKGIMLGSYFNDIFTS